MGEVVCCELKLEAIFCSGAGRGHYAGAVDNHVDFGDGVVDEDDLGNGADAGQGRG